MGQSAALLTYLLVDVFWGHAGRQTDRNTERQTERHRQTDCDIAMQPSGIDSLLLAF